MKKRQILLFIIGLACMFSFYHAYAEEGNESSEEENYGYIDTGDRVEYYIPASDGSSTMTYSSAIPSAYDSRDYGRVTSVKNQKSFGTCWAFAAMGAGESSLLSQGLVDSTDDIDMSEYQFAYFFYHYAVDPLENLKYDYTTAVGNSYLAVGGNNYYSMFALSSWRGSGDESIAPYENLTATSALDSSLAFNDIAHMQNTYIISMKNRSDVKRQIMTNGSVACSVYMDEYNYYNSETKGYYQNVSYYANHAILIVGWDDNYSVDNFNTSCKPTNNGAWLIKNSWGPNIDYFWVSYEDLCIANQDAFSYIFEKADNYDFNYQYDGAYSASFGNVNDGASIANVFECSGSDYEQIEAVSIALKDDNIKYSIQIYLNPPTGNPKGGTPLLDSPVTGATTYAGYYTIELDTPVTIESGDRFAVVFTLNNLDDASAGVSYYCDYTVSGSTIRFDSYTEADTTYIYSDPRYPDYAVDLYDGVTGWCPRIKAFTSIVENQSPRSINECTVTVNKQEYTGVAITPSPYVQYNNRVLVKNVDYTLSYKNNVQLGTGTITITGKGKYTGTKTITFEIVGKLNPTTVYGGVDYSLVYDYNYYVKKYSDIWKAYGKNDGAVIQHFVECGMKEGRQGKDSFNVTSYAYRYYDLRSVYKNDMKQYYLHYINCGKREGRIATGTTTMQGGLTTYNGVDYSEVYNVGYYAKKYGDLRKVFGFDDEAYLRHFIECGMKEGRQAIATFNVNTYRNRYRDLQEAFGLNLEQYYIHYIICGKREGRKGI